MTTTTITLPNYADAEAPVVAAGHVYLQNIPSPLSSLQFFKNGLLLSQVAGDFILTGQVITPTGTPIDPSDTLLAFYRY
jgi:hypothetical protein